MIVEYLNNGKLSRDTNSILKMQHHDVNIKITVIWRFIYFLNLFLTFLEGLVGW